MAIIEATVTDEAGKPVVMRIEVAEGTVGTAGIAGTAGFADVEHGRVTRGDSQVVTRAKDAFKESMMLIRTCATQISTTVQNIQPELRPKAFEVQFSIKVDGKVGAFIAESTVGAQLQVTLTWGEKG